jgi:alpha-tubulin suppressor-like RCC1 family protein
LPSRSPAFVVPALALVLLSCGRNEGPVLDSICRSDGGCSEAGTTSTDASADGEASTPPLSTVTSLAASAAATCATLADGALWCWGDDSDGALVAGGSGDLVPPARVGTDSDWAEVSGTHGHCATKQNHALWCWGPDDAVPSVATAAPFTQVAASVTWARPFAGQTHHCALASDQTLSCWGANDDGELGLGDTAARTTPTPLTGSWTSAALGVVHTCALQSGGSLWCWGHNVQGQLGLGDTNDRASPVRVGTGVGWSWVASGGNDTCAIDASGALWCWGENAYGELGTGDMQPQHAPVRIGTGTYREVAIGGGAACAIAMGGTLWCWGYFGQAMQAGQSLTPVQVDASGDWASIVTGYSHACGFRSGKGVYCLGWNFAGQLAQPASVTYSSVAVAIAF